MKNKNFKIIFCNDFSTDNSLEMLEEFKSKNSNLDIIILPKKQLFLNIKLVMITLSLLKPKIIKNKNYDDSYNYNLEYLISYLNDQKILDKFKNDKLIVESFLDIS